MYELESVLNHYVDDPEKLIAAKFLIENMPGHYSFADTALLRRYHLRADSFITASPEIAFAALCDSIDEIARLVGINSSPKVRYARLYVASHPKTFVLMSFCPS